jgi:TIR domain
MAKTIFGNVDLSKTTGLKSVKHEAPLIIGIDTIYRSKGIIPEIFLHGAGVPDSFISYLHLLVGHPIDYYSCFISYSSKDQAFAEQLYADLQSKGIRCWFAPENIRVGDKISSSIDESIRLYDKLLLIVSQHSMASQWVEREVEIALKKELKEEQTFLFPIRLDDSIMTSSASWAADIRKKRHIGDFTRWKEHDSYQKAFSRLIRDLKITVATESNMRGSEVEE